MGEDAHVFTLHQGLTHKDPPYVHRLSALIRIGNAGITPSLFKRLHGFDILHLHYPFFGGAEPIALRKFLHRNQALILTYHMDAVGEGIRGMIFKLHSKLLFPRIVARADRILVTSMDYAQSSELAKLKNIFAKIEVHPLGVDLKRFYPGKEKTLRQEHSVSSDHPVMIFVGGLDTAHHFKGLPVLINALSNLTSLSWYLLVVGEGDLKQSFIEIARHRNLEHRIHFLGSVADEVLPHYYRMADFHVFPSTERAEAFGLVTLEAAATGIPTIASSLPGVRTIVKNNETGLLTSPSDPEQLADTIRLLLEQKNLRKRLGEAARRRAEKEYNWETIINSLLTCYKTTLLSNSSS